MPLLSIVSPVYKTGTMLEELVQRAGAAAEKAAGSFEIILVDDGSPDTSWEQVEALAKKYPGVKGIRLSRNFGQHAAITAGLHHCNGEWIVVMDSDLQDVPETIIPLYEMAKQGNQVVVARRIEKTHSIVRRFSSRLFYRWISWLSEMPSDYAVANFGIYSRQVINEVIAMPETYRFFPMIINWIGFRRATLEYRHGERGQGASGYDARKLLRLAMNITLSYSDKPLRYVVKLGFLIALVTFLYGLVVLVRYLTGGITVLGYTSLILSVWFMGGILLLTLGVVGLYVGRTFEETKRRPLYVVEQKINV